MYTQFQTHSHYSTLNSILKPSDIVEYAAKQHMESVAITDLNNMAGIVQFVESCKKHSVKPILGVTLQTHSGPTYCLIAKNLRGYKSLLQIISEANSSDNYTNHPGINVSVLDKFGLDNLYLLDGHEDSSLYNAVYDKYYNCIRSDWQKYVAAYMTYPIQLFKHRFFIQSCRHFDVEIQNIYKDISKQYNIPIINNNIVRFVDDKNDLYNIIRATKNKTTIDNLDEILPCHFESSDHSCSVSLDLAKDIGEYEILSDPVLPAFDTGDKTSLRFLKEQCWQKMKELKVDANPEYLSRIGEEIKVIDGAGMIEYFLILQDIMNKVRSDGHMTGFARGSSAGCLISYLLGVTQIDPIKYNLLFSRFYNPGRGKSLPDIDVDIPKRARDNTIQYIVNKFGRNKVSQIATYQTLMGRAAIKAVLRAKNSCSFTEMNEITKNIEDKAKIADELQEMKERGEEPSVIMWALENRGHKLKEWVELDGDNIVGSLGNEFKMAIALEGTKSSVSKHAAGLVIGNEPLSNNFSMIWDEKSKSQIIGTEYEDAEKLGACKLDLLSLSSLDRIEDI